ncbi:hypothetical protein DM01DRAFT_265855 [Hesseltinella vesiculosa]|uniref:DUF788-domain-containing protein n=1 Tax=Hesseltinella vesiculosa TaxID=101127 RepID=A0A1X2GLH0_9FUNG|nr:hypothetical protein DM01DRAFT_265855 [Hesseltinella vesiculosa]
MQILYILWRVIYHWSTFSKGIAFLYISTTTISVLLWNLLRSSSTPTYAADGSLRSSGEDLNAEGLTAYCFDVIYITWFVAITTAIVSEKFWYTYLLIPGYALFKLVPLAMSYLGAMKGAGPEMEDTSAGKSKRQQKMEKRGGKVKFVR